MIISIYGITIYIILLFVISAFFIKKALNSYEEYSFCGRSLKITYILFTYLGTWIGGGTIIGLTSWAYLSGVSKYWIISVPYIVGFPFAILFITRIRKLNRYGIADMLALRYPKYKEIIRIPASIGIIIRNVTMVGMQFSALAYLITLVFGIQRELSILMIFLVIVSYTTISGLWGVVITDVFQGILQTVGLILLLYFSISLSGGLDNAFEYYQTIDKEEFLSLANFDNWWNQIGVYSVSLGFFFLVGDQGDWQRIYSSKTNKIAFWGFFVPLLVTLIWMLIPAYIGVFQRVPLLTEVDSEYATYKFILEMLNPRMASFILISLFAAIMSSADSFLLSTGFTFTNDIIKKFINKEANDKELIFWNRFFIVISGGIGFAFAINIENIINLWMTGIMISSSIILVPYLLAWFSKRVTTAGAISGMSAAGIYSLGCLLIVDTINIKIFWVGILINLMFSLSISFFTEKEDRKIIEKTYYWSESFKNIKNIPR